jgi:hypothetical protein
MLVKLCSALRSLVLLKSKSEISGGSLKSHTHSACAKIFMIFFISLFRCFFLKNKHTWCFVQGTSSGRRAIAASFILTRPSLNPSSATASTTRENNKKGRWQVILIDPGTALSAVLDLGSRNFLFSRVCYMLYVVKNSFDLIFLFPKQRKKY